MTLPTTNYIALHNGLYWVFANGRPVRIADAWEVARHKKETEPAQSSPPYQRHRLPIPAGRRHDRAVEQITRITK